MAAGISVKSRVGEGTEFRILLPSATEDVRREESRRLASESSTGAPEPAPPSVDRTAEAPSGRPPAAFPAQGLAATADA